MAGLRGEASPNAKLTATRVLTIRRRYAAASERGRRLLVSDWAYEYGVSQATVSNALRGRTWAHLPGAVRLTGANQWTRGKR